jgi:xylulokinase
MYFLGYDLGSSSVKAAVLNGETGGVAARSIYPDDELSIEAKHPGWAEQHPDTWWKCVEGATARVLASAAIDAEDLGGIGISYQMHGLVVVDADGSVLRPSIIWCDSRAVEIGRRAFEAIGRERCLGTLLSSPGNFTASKLAWVREAEPELFERVHRAMLPGDWLAYALTGKMATTVSGLSEGMFWDFEHHELAGFLLEHYGIPRTMVPDIVPTFGEQGRLTSAAARSLGLVEGTPVTYRAGDQPNNALSLGVLEPGEIAATAGTSGVVYGVSDTVRADRESRVNSFAHVNHSPERPRLGVLLCINGAGSSNRWARRLLDEPSYDELNRQAARAPIGCEGLCVYPFGNGAERMLGDRDLGASFTGLAFNVHERQHVARAVLEGVAFAFQYGMDILAELGVTATVLRAGMTNMFQSPVFRETLTGASGASLELYETDGAEGAARGAAVGASYYASPAEALESLGPLEMVEPDGRHEARYAEAYQNWLAGLDQRLR